MYILIGSEPGDGGVEGRGSHRHAGLLTGAVDRAPRVGVVWSEAAEGENTFRVVNKPLSNGLILTLYQNCARLLYYIMLLVSINSITLQSWIEH